MNSSSDAKDSVAGQLYRAPWQNPSQFLAYCKTIERSQMNLNKRQQQQSDMKRNRCTKELHDDDTHIAREAVVAEQHHASRTKLRELIKLSKGGELTELRPQAHVRVANLGRKNSTFVIARRSSNMSSSSAAAELPKLPEGSRSGLGFRSLEAPFASSVNESVAVKPKRDRQTFFEDEAGFIDVDEGSSNGEDEENGKTPCQHWHSSDDDSDAGWSDNDDGEEQFDDPRFVARLVSRWDEVERSRSLVSNLAGRSSMGSASKKCTASTAPRRSVAVMMASERPHAMQALLKLEAKRRTLLAEDEAKALIDAMARWQKLYLHIFHTEKLTAVRIRNLNDQELARRSAVELKEQQARNLLLEKEHGQCVQAKHKQTVRENMTAKEKYWANARQMELQKLKDMAAKMLMDVKHHSQVEDPINRMPPRLTRLGSAIMAGTPIVARRRKSEKAATLLESPSFEKVRRRTSLMRSPSANFDDDDMQAGAGQGGRKASRRKSSLYMLTASDSFSRGSSGTESRGSFSLIDEAPSDAEAGDRKDTGGLTEKQRSAMNERWNREAVLMSEKLRTELVQVRNTPDHAYVHDKLEIEREASRGLSGHREHHSPKQEVSQHFESTVNAPSHVAADHLKDPFFLKLEEARRKKHALMMSLVEQAEASKNKRSLAKLLDDMVVAKKEMDVEEELSRTTDEHRLSRWTRQRSVVHSNFFTGNTPVAAEPEKVSFESLPYFTDGTKAAGEAEEGIGVSIALSSFSTGADAAIIETDLLDATLTRDGARRRSSAFVKLKAIGDTVICLRRLSLGHSQNENVAVPKGSELPGKRERGNLANLVMASGLGRKNVEATRRENLNDFFYANSRAHSVANRTPAQADLSPAGMPDIEEYEAFSEPPSLPSFAEDEAEHAAMDWVVSAPSEPEFLLVEEPEEQLLLDPCSSTMPVGAVRPSEDDAHDATASEAPDRQDGNAAPAETASPEESPVEHKREEKTKLRAHFSPDCEDPHAAFDSLPPPPQPHVSFPAPAPAPVPAPAASEPAPRPNAPAMWVLSDEDIFT